MANKNQNETLLSVLKSGTAVDDYTAHTVYGIKNLRARINDLRKQGYAIYTNKNIFGEAQYRLGTPSKKLVAAAYRVFGARFFR
jgi:DNA-binding IclR family transcriptional regulator